MYFIGLKDFASQTVLAGGLINLGDVYRKYDKRTQGNFTFSNTNTGIILQKEGMYHITATFVGTGTEAGDVTIQLFENGVPVSGALTTQTITTADTEIRTFVIDYYVLVDTSCILGCNSVIGKNITFENIGIGATYSNVVVNVEKVV